MNKKLVVLTATFALMAGWVMAEDMIAAVPAVPAVAEKLAAVEVGNTICPISGEVIKEGEGTTIEVDGKIYNVCKAGLAMFEKNPEEMKEKIAAFDKEMGEKVEDMKEEGMEAVQDMKEEGMEGMQDMKEKAGEVMDIEKEMAK